MDSPLAFRDALSLQYGWSLQNPPSHCTCSHPFSIEHALTCKTGGFPAIRHNEVHDITAFLLSEVCHEVTIEPHLQPLTGELMSHNSAIIDDGARLDVAWYVWFLGRPFREGICRCQGVLPMRPIESLEPSCIRILNESYKPAHRPKL